MSSASLEKRFRMPSCHPSDPSHDHPDGSARRADPPGSPPALDPHRPAPEGAGAAVPRPLIRQLGGPDCAATAALHREHLTVGLFPQLGDRFLGRWHQTFASTPHGWVAVAVDGQGQVQGFALVATDVEQYVAEVLATQRWRLGVAGALALLRRPSVAARFVRTRGGRYARRLSRRGGRTSRTGAGVPGGELVTTTAVVYAMVTAPAVRGHGVGRQLLDAGVQAARTSGATRVCLLTRQGAHPPTPVRPADRAGRAGPAGRVGPADVTDSVAGDEPEVGAAGFYEHLGWQRVRTVEREGVVLVEFCLSLP